MQAPHTTAVPQEEGLEQLMGSCGGSGTTVMPEIHTCFGMHAPRLRDVFRDVCALLCHRTDVPHTGPATTPT